METVGKKVNRQKQGASRWYKQGYCNNPPKVVGGKACNYCKLVLFPGRSHPSVWSLAITTVSSCALVHGCQLDRRWGRCTTKDHEALSCSTSLKAGGQSIQQGSINIVLLFTMPGVGSKWSGNYYVRLPPVYHTWPDIPGFSPVHLHTASDQRLEAGTKRNSNQLYLRYCIRDTNELMTYTSIFEIARWS